MESITQTLSTLGVHHNIFTSESNDVVNIIDVAVKKLQNKDLVYQGILEKPKGNTDDEWEPREQTLFKSTEFGDDLDRALYKSDNSHTYFAADIGYHHIKIERGYNMLFLPLGADHCGYAKRLNAAVSALSDNKCKMHTKIIQLVNLMRDGNPIKMSKRSGNFLTANDVIQEVGKDIIRFVMLSRKNDTIIDFDFIKVKEQSKDNPVFYVQYAHARACSIIRNAKEIGVDCQTDIDYTQLTEEDEINLIKKAAEFPKILISSAKSGEPHLLMYYLQELANEFHSFFSKGNEKKMLRFIIHENLKLTQARIALVHSIIITLKEGLRILGIEAKSSM